ncbi:uncharacterized protein LOC100179341 [Ciona intestinalis]
MIGSVSLFCVALLLPCVVYSEKVMPVGHLMPLGHQSPPSVEIDEFTVDNTPDPNTFYEKYVKPGRAAIFRGAVKNTTGYKIWSDEYIRENYGDLEVRLEGKKESVHVTPIGETYLGRDNLRHFVDTYNSSNVYIVSELPAAMFKEVGVLPSIGACGEMAKRFVEIDIWWSAGGSKSIIHKDAFNQINCLYRGTKFWKMYEYKYEKWIHKHWEPENEVGGFSNVNVEHVNLIKHPNIAKIPWSNFTINEGDCLFLPKSYYHQVNSDGPNNLAVSILFGRFDGRESIDVSDCTKDTDYKTPKHLSELDVMWPWSGTGVMSMGWPDLEEHTRRPLIELSEKLEAVNQKITSVELEEMWGLVDEDDGKLRRGDYDKALSYLDTNGDKEVSLEEIKSATWEQLRTYIKEVYPYEPSNSYDFEYSFISYEKVLGALEIVMKRQAFSRSLWVKVYKKYCQGTHKYGNEVFTGLVNSEEINIVYSNSITKDVIARALKNWLYYWQPQYADSTIRPGTNVDVMKQEFDEHEVHEEDDSTEPSQFDEDERVVDEL